MRTLILSATFITLFSSAFAQLPSTDIYLIEFNVTKTGKYFFVPPYNFTKRAGYDNQPSFSPEGDKIFYASSRDTIQTDLYSYSIYDSITEQITRTPESEFSPVLLNDQFYVSHIKQEMDKKQHLNKCLLDGSEDQQILYTTDSAAYYAWINETTIAAVVLDKVMCLNIYELPSEQFTPLLKNVGRCVTRMFNSMDEVCYIDKNDTSNIMIMRFNVKDGMINPVAPMLKGSEDFAWTNDGKIIAGREGKLFMLDPSKLKDDMQSFDPKSAETNWVEIADFSKSIGNFYRIAVSPKGNKWAIVGYSGKKP